jgi:hypothetical protein
MKKLLALLAIVASNVFAVDLVIGPNVLVNGDLAGNAAGWTKSGMSGGADGNGGPGYTFSFQSGTIAQTYAINQALQGTGIQIHGFDYGLEYRFNCGQQIGSSCTSNSLQDTLNMTVTITDSTGASLYNRYYGLGSKNAKDGNSAYNPNWQNVDTQQRFTSPYDIANMGNFTMSITGMDAGFWGGNYGPNVRNAYSKPVYSVNQCSTDPLSSPTCPGYEAAYLSQQCSANPLYSPSCPGYQQAYHTQQCSIDPLTDPSCPGYNTAYYSHQCTMSPLYDRGCPGYAEAYLNEQCKKDSLYSTKCEGYATAYAIAYLVPLTPGTSSAINQSLSSTAAADPSKQATQTVKDDNVNTAITPSQSTSTSSVTSVTSVVREPNPETRIPPKEEKRSERVANPETREAPKEEKKEVQTPKKTAETKRRAEEAIKAATKAKTPEEVIASQTAIVGGMGLLPGFENYQNNSILDAQFYKSKDIYSNQKTVDNRNAQRFLSGASEVRHQMMVEEQYRR